MITGTTRLYAIIGDPIAHVRTPMAFNAIFERRGIDAVCLPVAIARNRLAEGWRGFGAMGNLDGFVVTAPHKAEAARLCDRLEGDGLHAGVVNTVRREPDGRFTGTLLDGRGFVAGLLAEGHAVAGRRFYLAGAGGAGQALAFALAAEGAAAVTVANRTGGKAADLVARLRAAYPACEVGTGTRDASGHDVAVNATALGLHPADPPAFDLDTVSPGTLVAEVVMMPEVTPLLRAAAARGLRVHSGRHMLDGQLGRMMAFFRLDTTSP